MKTIKIEEVYNGYHVELSDNDTAKKYAYGSTEDFKMLNEIGKFLFGMKIKTEKV